MQNGERVETLIKLGLTLNQARAYLALVQFGPAPAKMLSEASKITRQDIYRVMISLEKTGIVERILNKPTAYKATPIIQASRILLQRKTSEHKELEKKTRELVHSLENSRVEKANGLVDSQFVIVPGREVITQKLSAALQRVERTLEVVTSKDRFSPAIAAFSNGYLAALQRGVKIQIAFEKNPAQEQVLNRMQPLLKRDGFEVRCFADPPEAIVSIFDGKEAAVTVSTAANNSKASALWSNDASFVALIRNYFKSKWREAVLL